MLDNSTYRLTRFWCHSCRQAFLRDVSSGDFTCVNCRSELIEELNGAPAADDPRTFRAQTETTRPAQMPVFYTVLTTHFFQPPELDLERRIQAILNFINGHTGVHSGVQPASQSQIQGLQTVPGAEAAGKDCPICQEELTREGSYKKMPCGHVYHEQCLTRWLQIHNSCPVCRASVSGSPHTAASQCRM